MNHQTVTSRWSIEFIYALDQIIKQEVDDESIGKLPEAKQSASCCCCERCSECDCPECTGELLLKGERLDDEPEMVVLKDDEMKQEWFSPPNTPELGPEWPDDDEEDDRFSEALKTPAYVPSFYDDESQEDGENDDNAAAEPTQKRPFSPEVHEFTPNLNQAKLTSYQCTVPGCARIYQSRGTLNVHLIRHSGKFTCQQCGKPCQSKFTLEQHQLTHSGERPYQCTECQRAFAHKSALIKHYRTHSGERPYQCTQCDKSFTSSSNLTVHLRIHTGDRPYKCTYCSFAFSIKCNLTTHLRLHTGLLPFQCEVCSKRFNRKDHLTRHMRNNHC